MSLKSPLPVYCLDSFRETVSGHHQAFDIKRLEELKENFSLTQHPHKHNFYDVLIITKGSGKHTIDFTTYEVKPCSIFFLTPGQVHSWELSEDTTGYSIFFEADFYGIHRSRGRLRDMPFFHVLSGAPALYIDCEREKYVKEIVTSMFIEQKNHEARHAEIIRAYLELLLMKLSRFYEQGQEESATPYHQQKVAEYEELIEQYYLQKRQVKAYADMLNMTTKNLNTICKKGANKTAKELIHSRVILEAKRLLLHADLSVQQVGEKLDFIDDSYFVRYFRMHGGMTPEQFRKTYY